MRGCILHSRDGSCRGTTSITIAALEWSALLQVWSGRHWLWSDRGKLYVFFTSSLNTVSRMHSLISSLIWSWFMNQVAIAYDYIHPHPVAAAKPSRSSSAVPILASSSLYYCNFSCSFLLSSIARNMCV